MKIVIIGSGIMGLTSAYFLNNSDNQIEIIESDSSMSGASHGNAGYIAPGHVRPVANLEFLAKGIGWMFQQRSPFYIRPQLRLSLAKWLLRFLAACRDKTGNEERMVAQAMLNLLSQKEYEKIEKKLGKPLISKKGLFYLTKNEKLMSKLAKEKELSERFNIKASMCDASEVLKIDPKLKGNYVGGIHFHDDWHCDPTPLIESLKDMLIQEGTKFTEDVTAEQLVKSHGRVVAVRTSCGKTIDGDMFLVCTGSKNQLLKNAGMSLLIEPAKGYSITLKAPKDLFQSPFIVYEDKLAVTPMGENIRFGGTLELSGHDNVINKVRIDTIMDKAKQFLPDFPFPQYNSKDFWFGYRPLSFDTLPFIGNSHEYDNLFANIGHGMLGLTQAAGSSKLVSEMMIGKTSSIATSCFDPYR